MNNLCQICRKEFGLIEQDDFLVCPNCYDDWMTNCDVCEIRMLHHALTNIGCATLACPKCVNQGVRACCACGQLTRDQIRPNDQGIVTYCHTCFDNIFQVCRKCKHAVDHDDYLACCPKCNTKLRKGFFALLSTWFS
jgi:hypothetical protein